MRTASDEVEAGAITIELRAKLSIWRGRALQQRVRYIFTQGTEMIVCRFVHTSLSCLLIYGQTNSLFVVPWLYKFRPNVDMSDA